MVTQPEVARGGAIGRYIVLGLVGRGAMGEVYAAYDPQLDRKVAVKLLRAETSRTGGAAEAKSRLLREAQSMAKLSHPNVIGVHDVGSFGEQVFVAMDFVDGHTVTYWLHASTRTWNEILRVFLAAGKGLVAAHAANMVHRDFKAENVMLGHDGQVRVMDFGLARQLSSASANPWAAAPGPALAAPAPAVLVPDDANVGSTRALPAQQAIALGGFAPPTASETSGLGVGSGSSEIEPVSLTRTGHVMGTPAYMAPELFRGLMADARSDQFSFCVSVYEALYGTHPFGGTTLEQLIESVLRGQVRPPPETTRVPGWVRRVLLRGLQIDPAARWPSMDALLAALSHNPRLRPLRYVASAAVVAAIVVAGALGRQTSGSKPVCVMPADRFVGVWEPAGRGGRRAAIGEAMRASGKPYAAGSFSGLERLLDRYVHDWSVMYRDACEATNVRHDQSAEVLDLRMSCLRDRWKELRALSDVLVEGQGVAVTNAVAAASALTPIERCDDAGVLSVGLAQPADPKTRQRVATLRNQLVEVNALHNAGHYSRGLDLAARVLNEARSLGYRPVVAEALYRLAVLQMETGQVAAADSLEQAFWTAQASAHDELATEVAVESVFVAGYQRHDMPQAQRWMSQAQALLERIGGHDQLRAWMLNNFAGALYAAGRNEEAAAEYFRALQIKERLLGKDHPDVASTLNSLADQLRVLGRPLEALDYSNRAVEIIDHTFGPRHPAMAGALGNRAEIFNQLGRHQEALQDAERAVTIDELELGPDRTNLIFAVEPLGEAQVGLGHPADAIRPLERGIELAEGSDLAVELPRLRFDLGRALWDSGRDRTRAIRLVTMAARQKTTHDAGSQEQIHRRALAWLATRGRPPQ